MLRPWGWPLCERRCAVVAQLTRVGDPHPSEPSTSHLEQLVEIFFAFHTLQILNVKRSVPQTSVMLVKCHSSACPRKASGQGQA